ncbi:hypothetical protein MJI46_34220, partial [Salmonella enterica subsp. enterica serovar Cerro]|nr:hypothetical protein [Salmonella enterica subsp. enterica serovar Cerro]
ISTIVAELLDFFMEYHKDEKWGFVGAPLHDPCTIAWLLKPEIKQFNSITDYHSLMFDLGIIARRLRSASDRSKFYRLIEASLYG